MTYEVYRANVKKSSAMGGAQQEFAYEGTIELDVPMRVGEYVFNSRIVRIDYLRNNFAMVQIEGSTFR